MDGRKKESAENTVFRMLYLIAILFVIDGHIPLEGELLNFGGLFRYYSFHMLLFAFGSGYFFNTDRSFGEALARDCKHLLAPLYLLNLVYGLLAWGLRRFLGMTLGEPLSLYTLLAAPILDGQHFAYNVGAWFIGALFLVKLLYRCLYVLFGRTKAPDLAAFAISLLIGSLAVIYARAYPVSVFSLPVPLFLLRALILLPGYALGNLYRTRLERLDRMPSVPYLTVLVLLRVLFTTLVPENAYLLSDATYFPCGPAGIYIGGFLAIAFYLRIARILSPCLERSPALLFASRHTFGIMMNHGLGMLCVNFVFLVLNKFHFGAPDFSVSQFRTAQGYLYAPGGAPQWAVLYVIAGMAFSCALSWVFQWIKRKRLSGKGR